MSEREYRPPGSEEQRFEELYAAHVHTIASYLRARTDRDSAVDALARTFEIAWRRLSDVPDEPKPWLFGVARRVLADQRRSAGRQETLIERISESLRESADDHAETLSVRQAILAALSELAPVQREALLLIAWDGLTHREAAAALGCSTGALAVRVHRARRHLRAAIAQHDIEHPDGASLTAPPLKRSPKEAL
jgi:RNA polymerase sigma-70 factor (ECF subfamily)